MNVSRDDRIRCQLVVDKYTSDAKKYGSRTQYKRSLELLLPISTLYDFLEGRIPQPAHTYSKIADIVEAEEKEKINTEIGQRRTRLGAKIDQVTAEVREEILGSSLLEGLFNSIIDWTQDDHERRHYEEKLLQHAYDTLVVLPTAKKAPKRRQVYSLAQGLVILKHPFLLAWMIKFDWDDINEIENLDAGLLREFMTFFPDEGLSKILRGYLDSDMSPFCKNTAAPDDDSKEGVDMDSLLMEDRLLLMSEGMEEISNSVLANRLMGQIFLHLEEYGSASFIARRGLDIISRKSVLTGFSLPHSLVSMNIILATALVQFQAPRHHPEAMELFESVLRGNPAETSALIGIGLILEEQEAYAAAVEFFNRSLKQSLDPRVKAEAAWCNALNGEYEASINDLEACLLELQDHDTRTMSLRSKILYRIGMCLWDHDTSPKARKSRDGAYARFLASLQADLNFAPPYTSLGIYYADYGKDKKRARKCFQKAFELSSAEVLAAERLARSFAQSSEWDLVEVVAQRALESGNVRPAPGSRKKGVSWPFAALGVVQLNKREYAKSVVSFQSALRTSPTDYYGWVGLGESYHNSGRYIAATKAFEHAQKLESASEDEGVRNNWFSKYMLANVKRELGEYDSAVNICQEVLTTRPDEYGVSIALLQSMVESAWHSVGLGYFGRAAGSATDAISVAQNIVKQRTDSFNLWKAVGDACSIYTHVQGYASNLPWRNIKSLLEDGIHRNDYDNLVDIDGIGEDSLGELAEDGPDTVSSLAFSTRAAIMAHKCAIHACARDVHARAVAWYNLGWIEHRAHVCGCEIKALPSRNPLRHLKASVQSFKRAIELEAGNAEFWNALGVVTTELDPRVSQHSFVRSLHLNDKNARVWTNLGILYLVQEDYPLANNAFARAQSSDPDYSQAWLGQGFLATRSGETHEARRLFTHAFDIADSSSTTTKQQYAMSSFDHLVSSSPSSNTTTILQPLFALHQLRSQNSANLPFENLASSFAERVGSFADAAFSLDSVASELEADYETAENQLTLTRFAQAKADLARAQLAIRDFSAAAENSETGLSLSDDEELEKGARERIRLSAYMTAGLAYYHRGSMDQAISMFRNALEETGGNPDIVCLLVQVLWAKGGDEERNVAREQLFACVEKHPGHVHAIALLGTISVIDDDRDTIEAVASDLQSLRTGDALDLQQQGTITRLLTAIAIYLTNDKACSELGEATRAVMLVPSQSVSWSQLADESEVLYPAEMAVLTAIKGSPPNGDLDAGDLCKAYAGTRRADDAQRGIMIAPWIASPWESLI